MKRNKADTGKHHKAKRAKKDIPKSSKRSFALKTGRIATAPSEEFDFTPSAPVVGLVTAEGDIAATDEVSQPVVLPESTPDKFDKEPPLINQETLDAMNRSFNKKLEDLGKNVAAFQSTLDRVYGQGGTGMLEALRSIVQTATTAKTPAGSNPEPGSVNTDVPPPNLDKVMTAISPDLSGISQQMTARGGTHSVLDRALSFATNLGGHKGAASSTFTFG